MTSLGDIPAQQIPDLIRGAARSAATLVPAGPRVSRSQGKAAVQMLRNSARQAVQLAGSVTGLAGAARAAEQIPVRVLSRAGWLAAVGEMTADLLAAAAPANEDSENQVKTWIRRLAVRPVTEVGLAGAMAAVAPHILGQFNPFAPGGGELLLVAPNIVKQERAADYDVLDYRLWVCLHEQTHNLQAQAAPWLAPYMRAEIAALIEKFSTHDDAAASAGQADQLEMFADERSRRLLSLVAFLEGHADVVMDAVGPMIIPSVKLIRARTEAARNLPRRLPFGLGVLMGEKMRQYRQGADFVRAVIAERGHDGFAPLWASPQAIPTWDEIENPERWLARTASPAGATPASPAGATPASPAGPAAR